MVQLKTFKVSAAKSQGKLPSRIKLLNWGRNETSEGTVIVDDVTARVFSANQRKIGRERVALDYEHNTVPGSPEYERTQEPRDIAGNLTLSVVAGEGLYGEALTYTSTGEAKCENYEDLSLAPFVDKDGRVIGAHSVALTRTGAAYGITFQEAQKFSSSGLLGEMKTLNASITPNNSMTEKFLSLAALAAILGLAADADEKAVTDKLKLALTPPAVDLNPLSARITTLEGMRTATGAVDLKPLTDKIAALEAKLLAGETAATDAERGRLITLFSAEGKAPKKADGTAYTAEELKKLDVGLLQLLHANTPVTVPLSARSAISQTDGARGRHVEKDASGKVIRVDLAAMFDEEAAARGTARPNI
jgi:hypothetical protein